MHWFMAMFMAHPLKLFNMLKQRTKSVFWILSFSKFSSFFRQSQKNQLIFHLYNYSVQGAAQVKQSPLLDSFTVFLLPPSMELLEQRLRGRQTETEEQIQKRLKNAVGEIETFKNDQKLPAEKKVFDIGVVSAQDGVDETAERIAQILKKANFKL